MITCISCKAFAAHVSTIVNGLGDVEQVNIKPCKRCGSIIGDYEDYEELGIDELNLNKLPLATTHQNP